MNLPQPISNLLNTFDERAKSEVNHDLGSGKNFKLIGRNGLIFCRGPFCWELNVDARTIGGIFCKDVRAWIFVYDSKKEVQVITRKACDLTAARQNFFHDAHNTRLVRKRLYESESKIKIHENSEIGLLFFRTVQILPPRIVNDLKILAKAKWCAYTDSWFTSNLYSDALRKIFFEFNRGFDSSFLLKKF